MIGITDIQEIREDHRQRLCVASLTGYCEGLISSGALTEISEMRLRLLVIQTQNIFGIPTKAERTVQVGDHRPERVS